jgi:DNA-binding response OmpR family regulator
LDAISAQAARAIAEDGLVVASGTQETDPREVITRAMVAVAEESAALAWERARRPCEKTASRRVQALLRVAELVVLREQLARESGDLNPEHVERAVGMLISEVEQVSNDVAEPEVANVFMSRLHAKMKAGDFPGCCTERSPR